MQVTKGTWRMRKQCVPGSLSSSPAREPGNEASILTDLKKAGLKLKLPKCKFFRKEVEFLSHIITADSLKPNSAHTAAVTNFPEPQDIKGIQQFVGLASYYRCFIPNLR